MYAIPFPPVSPEIFSIELGGFTFALRWYALAYLAGFLIGWRLVVAAVRRPALWPGGQAPMAEAAVESLVAWMIGGIILGGRLGFVFFYHPDYYLANPGEILRVWEGGMSFHGGLAGLGGGGVRLRAAARRAGLGGGRRGDDGGAGRAVPGAHRQLHQRRTLGPPDRGAVGRAVPGPGRDLPARLARAPARAIRRSFTRRRWRGWCWDS
jgi:hypothetical protein